MFDSHLLIHSHEIFFHGTKFGIILCMNVLSNILFGLVMSTASYITAFLFLFGYLCIAVVVFSFFYNINEDLKQGKFYKEHPERYGVSPTWVLALIAILWPLQIVGLFIYILREVAGGE